MIHGAGGDELFGGYNTSKILPLAATVNSLPNVLKRVLGLVLNKLWLTRDSKLLDLLGEKLNEVELYLWKRTIFSNRTIENLAPSIFEYRQAELFKNWIGFCSKRLTQATGQNYQLTTLELLNYCGWKLLPDADVFSMAHGVEVRVPLIDYRLYKSSQEVINDGENKSKDVLLGASRLFPIDLMTKQKVGFTLPKEKLVRSILRNHKDEIVETLSKELKFDASTLRKFIDINAYRPNRKVLQKIWMLIVLAKFLKSHHVRQMELQPELSSSPIRAGA